MEILRSRIIIHLDLRLNLDYLENGSKSVQSGSTLTKSRYKSGFCITTALDFRIIYFLFRIHRKKSDTDFYNYFYSHDQTTPHFFRYFQ